MTTTTSCKERLEFFLKGANVPFEEHKHPIAYTAQAVAEAEHVSGKNVAKVVIGIVGDVPEMFVLPAAYRLDLQKAARAVAADEVRLAHEAEFEALFPDSEVGAMPPFGELYGIRTYLDESLAEAEYIIFQAGTHDEAMKMKGQDYLRVVRPTVVDIAFRG